MFLSKIIHKLCSFIANKARTKNQSQDSIKINIYRLEIFIYAGIILNGLISYFLFSIGFTTIIANFIWLGLTIKFSSNLIDNFFQQKYYQGRWYTRLLNALFYITINSASAMLLFLAYFHGISLIRISEYALLGYGIGKIISLIIPAGANLIKPILQVATDFKDVIIDIVKSVFLIVILFVPKSIVKKITKWGMDYIEKIKLKKDITTEIRALLNAGKNPYTTIYGYTRNKINEIVSGMAIIDKIELEKRYKNLAFVFHPDKSIYLPEDTKLLFQEISQAYEILKDPTKILILHRLLSQYNNIHTGQNVDRRIIAAHSRLNAMPSVATELPENLSPPASTVIKPTTALRTAHLESIAHRLLDAITTSESTKHIMDID